MGFLRLVTFSGAGLSAILALSNYLVAYIISGTALTDALFYNPYVKFWAVIAAVLLGAAVIMSIFSLLTKKRGHEDEYYDYGNSNESTGGNF